jgi:hypothetical protein
MDFDPSAERPAPVTLLSLADDAQRTLLSRLDGASLCASACACTALRDWIDGGDSSDEIWRASLCQRWGWLVGHSPRESVARGGMKAMYRDLDANRTAKFLVTGCALPDLPVWAPVWPHRMPPRLSAYVDGNPAPWRSLPPPSVDRSMAGAVRDADGAFVAIGGLSTRFDEASRTYGALALDSVERFCDWEWAPMPALSRARCCVGAACDSRGRLYAVGGGESMYAQAAAFDSVEVYDGGEAWRRGPSMSEPRCGHGCAISHAREQLVAVGGYGGQQRYLSSAERLDLLAGDARWEPLPPLSCKRAGCSAAVGPDERVYCLGGGDNGRTCHGSMEALDMRMRAWDISLAQPQFARHYNASAFGPDGRLYVSGTFRHDGQLDTVERYDVRADKWETLANIGEPIQFSSGAFIF